MKYYELNKEEQEILDAAEAGKLIEVGNQAAVKAQLVEAARLTNNKTRNINIRVSERLLRKLKAKAAEDGIPYQTLAASILHRNAQ